MKIKLIFESNLKYIFKNISFHFKKDDTINDIISYLYEIDDATIKASLTSFAKDIDSFYSKVLILINDTEISAINDKDSKINDGDAVLFLPITHGG